MELFTYIAAGLVFGGMLIGIVIGHALGYRDASLSLATRHSSLVTKEPEANQ